MKVEKNMKKFKIGYFADGKWAHEAFKLLIQDSSVEIAFICARYDSSDTILENFAKTSRIDFLKNKNVNSIEFIDEVRKYECDLFVSMSFNQIFKKEITNIPPMKTINCHAGKLPFYRGRNILNWALINDEKEFGITVHFIDEGIDTGDIILQRVFPISDVDDYNSLLEKAYIECAIILYDSIKVIQNGNLQTIKQDSIHPLGFYCGIRKEGDEKIDWNQTSRELFNFIRAICKPGPMARCRLNGKTMLINRSVFYGNAIPYKGIPGQIVGKQEDFIWVKTKDSVLKITEFEFDGKLKLGDRLE